VDVITGKVIKGGKQAEVAALGQAYSS
jgi:hypothetical protein